MKALVLLLLGAVAGAVATVMFFSRDPAFENQGNDGPGGGNARISLDAEALATIFEAKLSEITALGPDPSVTVEVNPNGLIDVAIGVGVVPVGVALDLVVDPEVVDGELAIVIAEAGVGELVAPEQVQRIIEAELQDQLDNLAAGFEYRLTAITTTDNRLTLEIEI